MHLVMPLIKMLPWKQPEALLTADFDPLYSILLPQIHLSLNLYKSMLHQNII